MIHRLGHTLAHVAITAVTQLVGLMGSGAGTTGDDGASAGTTFEQNLSFHCGVAAGVEHLTGHDGVDDEIEGIEHVMWIEDPGIL